MQKPQDVGHIKFVLSIIDDVCRERGLICITDPDNDIYIGKYNLSGIVVKVGNTLGMLKTINFPRLIESTIDCGSELECRRLVEEEIERCCM